MSGRTAEHVACAGRARDRGRGVPVAAVCAGRRRRLRRHPPAAHRPRDAAAARLRRPHGEGAGRHHILVSHRISQSYFFNLNVTLNGIFE